MTTEPRLTPPVVDPAEERPKRAGMAIDPGILVDHDGEAVTDEATAVDPADVPATPIDIDQVFAAARTRRQEVVAVIEQATKDRDGVNKTVKLERARIDSQAKADRAAANKRIAEGRAELAKIDRLLAAEKPRTKKGK